MKIATLSIAKSARHTPESQGESDRAVTLTPRVRVELTLTLTLAAFNLSNEREIYAGVYLLQP